MTATLIKPSADPTYLALASSLARLPVWSRRLPSNPLFGLRHAAAGLLGFGLLVRAVGFLVRGLLAGLGDVRRACGEVFAFVLLVVDDFFVVLDVAVVGHKERRIGVAVVSGPLRLCLFAVPTRKLTVGRNTVNALMSNEIILRKVQSLGVVDPLRATAETVRVVLGAYFTKKVLDEETFPRLHGHAQSRRCSFSWKG